RLGVSLRMSILKKEIRMTWRESWFCILATAWAVTASASQDRPVRSDQQILIELEQGWNAAFYRKDVRFIENLLAEQFIATYDEGSRGDKAKELALSAEFNEQIDSSTLVEFTVKVNGYTAGVWFSMHLVVPCQCR